MLQLGRWMLTLTDLTSLPFCPQVLRGAQLIAVASADSGAAAVEGSSLPPDIQVQYVQLAPVTDHTAAVQVKCPSHIHPPKKELLPGTNANRLRASIPQAFIWGKTDTGANLDQAHHTCVKVSADLWDLVSHLCSSALCLCRPVISWSQESSSFLLLTQDVQRIEMTLKIKLVLWWRHSSVACLHCAHWKKQPESQLEKSEYHSFMCQRLNYVWWYCCLCDSVILLLPEDQKTAFYVSRVASSWRDSSTQSSTVSCT